MAAGIIEKSNNGLFENEIEMNGNYATIVRHLKDDHRLAQFYKGFV